MEEAYAAERKMPAKQQNPALKLVPVREAEARMWKDAACDYFFKNFRSFDGVSLAMENTLKAIEKRVGIGEKLDRDGLIILCRGEALKVQAPRVLDAAVELARNSGTLKKGITQRDIDAAQKGITDLISRGNIFDEEGIYLYINKNLIKGK